MWPYLVLIFCITPLQSNSLLLEAEYTCYFNQKFPFTVFQQLHKSCVILLVLDWLMHETNLQIKFSC